MGLSVENDDFVASMRLGERGLASVQVDLKHEDQEEWRVLMYLPCDGFCIGSRIPASDIGQREYCS